MAHKLINYILDPAMGAKLSKTNRCASPDAAAPAIMDPRDRTNPAICPSDELMAAMEYLEDVGGDNCPYDKVWTAVKSC